MPGYHAGRSPRNRGQRCPADPPTVAEIVAVMRHAGTGLHAARLRALIVVLWRAGLRIHEALALAKQTSMRGAAHCWCAAVRAVADARSAWIDWACEQLQPWLTARTDLAVGPLLCIASGPTRDARGQPAPPALSCATPPPERACAGASYHTSSVTRTPSRWPARACR